MGPETRERALAEMAARMAIPEAERQAEIVAKLKAARSGDPIARLAMLADLCPHASGPCGCGTGPPRICGHPDRPAEVRRGDCLECVARSWWESGTVSGGH